MTAKTAHRTPAAPVETGVGPSLREVGSNTVAALLLLGVATGVTLAFPQAVKLSSVATVFFIAILAVALMFGLLQSLLSVVLSFLAVQIVMGAPLAPLHLATPDGILLVLIAAGVAVTGRETDVVTDRNRRLRALMGGAGAEANGGEAKTSSLGPTTSPEAHAREELLRVVTSFCIVGVGIAARMLAMQWLGEVAATLCLAASIVIVGAALGARFGFASGVLAAVILSGPNGHVLVRPLEPAFEIVALAGFGYTVGKLADQLQRERTVLATLVAASRNLSSQTSEADIRVALLDGLRSIGVGAKVHVVDDVGGPIHSCGFAPNPDWAANDPRWRTRELAADGRAVGLVRWRFGGAETLARDADEIAKSLIDLGAAAILRARLSMEKGDMEFVARTEQLRMILLDAVSHHFRSPLTGILGSVTSILSVHDEQPPAVRREFLLIIKEQANRLSRYVDSFLSVARLESGSVEVKLSELSLESLIYDVWDTFGEAGGARRFLQVTVDPRPVRSDPNLLAQVLGNLLENAIKYSPEGSVVDVQGRLVPGQVVIEIADQGPGVPPQSLDLIFGRFFRNPGATAPGLGLGLYITRSLIEILGGVVAARNRADGETGLVLSITLPLAEAAP